MIVLGEWTHKPPRAPLVFETIVNEHESATTVKKDGKLDYEVVVPWYVDDDANRGAPPLGGRVGASSSSTLDDEQDNDESSSSRSLSLLGQLDRLGRKSAEAQGLKFAITSRDSATIDGSNNKTRQSATKATTTTTTNTKDRILYVSLHVSRDTDADPSSTPVVAMRGYLRVGTKRLFLHRPPPRFENDLARETWSSTMMDLAEVPCVLDFYVDDRFQRSGRGGKLFDAMLCDRRFPNRKNNDERIVAVRRPDSLAYDRPSPRMIAFLHRRYGGPGGPLEQQRFTVHSNNFAVFDGFWQIVDDDDDDDDNDREQRYDGRVRETNLRRA